MSQSSNSHWFFSPTLYTLMRFDNYTYFCPIHNVTSTYYETFKAK